MDSSASAVWSGSLKEGEGKITTKSEVLSQIPYTFKTRFEGAAGTNPEELLAAAHAGCFSMALSNILGGEDLTPEKIETSATVTLDKTDDGFGITKVHLEVQASVPNATAEKFQECAEKAKAGCPVSKLFKTEITMTASLS